MTSLRVLPLLLLLLLVSVTRTQAQDNGTSSDPLIKSLISIHNITEDFILGTAEMLDEEMYAYRPSVNVRTAGQILAHITNAQFGVCSTAAGEESPAEGNYEEIATTRDDILAALKSSFEYCRGVYTNMTEEKGKEIKPFFGGERRANMTVSSILSFNSTHNYEHYGNLVTYMRINGITPPSSQ